MRRVFIYSPCPSSICPTACHALKIEERSAVGQHVVLSGWLFDTAVTAEYDLDCVVILHTSTRAFESSGRVRLHN